MSNSYSNINYDKIFIHAHACRLNTKIKLPEISGIIKLYFKCKNNECLVGDATQIDLSSKNYIYSTNVTYDYSLDFYDSMEEFGLNSFGIFTNDANEYPIRMNFDYTNLRSINLSEIITFCNTTYNTTKFYLHICRTPCIISNRSNKSESKNGGKKKKHKQNKTKRS